MVRASVMNRPRAAAPQDPASGKERSRLRRSAGRLDERGGLLENDPHKTHVVGRELCQLAFIEGIQAEDPVVEMQKLEFNHSLFLIPSGGRLVCFAQSPESRRRKHQFLVFVTRRLNRRILRELNNFYPTEFVFFRMVYHPYPRNRDALIFALIRPGHIFRADMHQRQAGLKDAGIIKHISARLCGYRNIVQLDPLCKGKGSIFKADRPAAGNVAADRTDRVSPHTKRERPVHAAQFHISPGWEKNRTVAGDIQAADRGATVLHVDDTVIDRQILICPISVQINVPGGERYICVADGIGVINRDLASRNAAAAGQGAVVSVNGHKTAAGHIAFRSQRSAVCHGKLRIAHKIIGIRKAQAPQILQQQSSALMDKQRRSACDRQLAHLFYDVFAIGSTIVVLCAVIIIDGCDVSVVVPDRLRTGAAENQSRLIGHHEAGVVDRIFFIKDPGNRAVDQQITAVRLLDENRGASFIIDVRQRHQIQFALQAVHQEDAGSGDIDLAGAGDGGDPVQPRGENGDVPIRLKALRSGMVDQNIAAVLEPREGGGNGVLRPGRLVTRRCGHSRICGYPESHNGCIVRLNRSVIRHRRRIVRLMRGVIRHRRRIALLNLGVGRRRRLYNLKRGLEDRLLLGLSMDLPIERGRQQRRQKSACQLLYPLFHSHPSFPNSLILFPLPGP